MEKFKQADWVVVRVGFCAPTRVVLREVPGLKMMLCAPARIVLREVLCTLIRVQLVEGKAEAW